MGPDLDLKGRSHIVMEASGIEENVGVIKGLEAFMDGQTEGAGRSQDMELNILEHTLSGGIGLVEAEHQDGTQNSSSFGDSVSGVENGAMLSDAEVDSELHGDASSVLSFNGYGEIFRMRRRRRRRLTPHWRAFIRPLTWRCKWVELQIKKFQSQAIKYDGKLAEYNRRKQFGLESLDNCTLEGIGAKSFPFSGERQIKKVMKRKKRERVEDTVDVASYMSHHNLFCYYENKRSAAAGAAIADDWGNRVISAEKTINSNDVFGVNDESLLLEFIDSDNSLDQILRKIEIVQSQVGRMKTRLQEVMSVNAGKFSSTDRLSLLASCDALTSSGQNPASPGNNSDRMLVASPYIATQHIPKYNRGDMVMTETAASNHGEVTHVRDIFASKEQPEVEGSSKNIGDGILIFNHRVEEELNNFKEVSIQPMEKPQVRMEEQDSSISSLHFLEPDLPADEQPPPKIRSIAKLTATMNKRKRARWKAGSSRRNQQSSG